MHLQSLVSASLLTPRHIVVACVVSPLFFVPCQLWNHATRASPYSPTNPIRSPNGPAVENHDLAVDYVDCLLKRFYPWLRLLRTLTVLEAQARPRSLS
jgi:hypothetical protein